MVVSVFRKGCQVLQRGTKLCSKGTERYASAVWAKEGQRTFHHTSTKGLLVDLKISWVLLFVLTCIVVLQWIQSPCWPDETGAVFQACQFS